MKARVTLIALIGLALVAAPALADAGNPCNPHNPCGEKAHAKNLCAGKAMHAAELAVNPCHAKMGTVFYVSDPMQRNTVTFRSEAPLEDIVGTTNAISGYVVFDPRRPEKGANGSFIVPVGGLTTGIPLRDEHLRQVEWLDAGRYPEIAFTIDGVKDVQVVSEKKTHTTYALQLTGELSLHGKSRRVTMPARVTYLSETEQTRSKLPGNLLAARTSFEVSLRDFGVSGFDGVIGSKVSDMIGLEISFTATDRSPDMNAGNPCNPCNPCGEKGRS